MKLFHVHRDKVSWDELRALAILARDETEARRLAQEEEGTGDFAFDWLNRGTCEEIGIVLTSRGPEVLVADFWEA